MTEQNEQNEQTEISATELDQLMDTLHLRKQSIRDAERQYEEFLLTLSERAGKTFAHDGQWYQVVVRFSKKAGRKVPFLKHLPGPPRSWLTGMPKGGWNQRTDVPDITQLNNPEVTETGESQEAASEEEVPPLPDVENLDTDSAQL